MRSVIVIPTYNEAGNIRRLIEEIRLSVPEADILVVDDNSPDGTGALVSEVSERDLKVKLYARPGKGGLGAAYLAAFKKVLKEGSADTIVMMDADFSHDPKYLPTMLQCAGQYDVVLGSRYIPGGATVGWEAWRRALSYFGNLYARKVAGLPVHDCTGGYNVISVARLKTIDLDSMNVSGYAFIMGLKFCLARAGASFKEIPIIFHNRTGGESKLTKAAIARYFREGILAPWRMRFHKGRSA